MIKKNYDFNNLASSFFDSSGLSGFISSKSIDWVDKPSVNFVLNDFLALGSDVRLKQGTIKAVREGIEVSGSLESLYQKAEEYLSWIFDKPILLFPQSSLIHNKFLPFIIEKEDAVLLDHHAQSSLRIATDHFRNLGNYTEIVSHSNVKDLEIRINALRKRYKKIWYLAESIYSTFGDVIPGDEIYKLVNQYPQFRVYIDDSKGMSWVGENGRGYISTHLSYHPQILVFTSLCKGFGADGGIIICYDSEMKEKLSKSIMPDVLNSLIKPTILGAIIESARIHLSNEIYERQSQLNERINLFNTICLELGLPKTSSSLMPIAFFITGKPEISQEICFNLMDKGYYLSVANFLSVSINGSGIRANISLHQSKDEIRQMLRIMKEEYEKALKKRSLTINDLLINDRKSKQLI